MAKWHGKIGYAKDVETSPGVWEKQYFEHRYYGDVIQDNRKNQPSDGLNDNLTITNEISIISDTFAISNFASMVYVEFMGVKWKITNVKVLRPRLILSIGGVYNV